MTNSGKISISFSIEQKISLSMAFLFLLSSFSCARFRIEQLSPDLIFSIPVATEHDAENIRPIALITERVPHNFPVRPAISPGGSQLALADAAHHRVLIYPRNQTRPDRILTHFPIETDNRIEVQTVPIGIPGLIAVGDENVYIESRPYRDIEEPERLLPEQRPSGLLDPESMQSSPSTIIMVRPDGSHRQIERRTKLEGQAVDTTLPFENILRINTSGSTLYVLHNRKKPVLSVYNNGNHVVDIEAAEIEIDDSEAKLVEVENIIPTADERTFLSSIVIRQRTNYEPVERRVFRISVSEDSQNSNDSTEKSLFDYQELLVTDNINDRLAWYLEDGFYMKNTEEAGRLLLKIFSGEGEYLNNHLLSPPGLQASWRETYFDLTGRILTSRVFRGNFEIYHWR